MESLAPTLKKNKQKSRGYEGRVLRPNSNNHKELYLNQNVAEVTEKNTSARTIAQQLSVQS
jgi:hypothetical protein